MALSLGGPGHDDTIQGAAPIPPPKPKLADEVAPLLTKLRAAKEAAAGPAVQDWQHALDHLDMVAPWVEAAEARG